MGLERKAVDEKVRASNYVIMTRSLALVVLSAILLTFTKEAHPESVAHWAFQMLVLALAALLIETRARSDRWRRQHAVSFQLYFARIGPMRSQGSL